RNIEQGFYSLMFLAQAIADEGLPGPIRLTALTTGAAQVKAEALPYPEKAMILGPARVIPREVPGLAVGTLDLGPLPKDPAPLVDRILEDLIGDPALAALRGERRYELGVKPAPLPEAELSFPQGAHV